MDHAGGSDHPMNGFSGSHSTVEFVVTCTIPMTHNNEGAKSIGPSYPQAREVVGEDNGVDGFWIAYSINKEDIGVTRVKAALLR